MRSKNDISNTLENISTNISKSELIALFVFDNSGNLDFLNQAALNLVGICSDENYSSYNLQRIFDFRISEINSELEKYNEISKEINIIDKNKNFLRTKTIFLKNTNGIQAISIPLSQEKNVNKMTQTLNNISELLNSSLEIEDNLNIVLKKLKIFLDYDKALIFFLEGDNLSLKASKNLINKDKNYKKNLL